MFHKLKYLKYKKKYLGLKQKSIDILNLKNKKQLGGSGEVPLILNGHSGWVNSVSYSPDGTRIVSGSYDGTLRQWDAVTGKHVGKPLRGHSSMVGSVSYSPDGTRIVCVKQRWNAASMGCCVWRAGGGGPCWSL